MKMMRKHFDRLYLPGTLIILLMLLNYGSAQDKELLTGIVKATEWQDNKVTAALLVITTDEENEEGKLTTYIDQYMILDNQIGKQLFKLNGKKVEVSAVFLEEDNGTVHLKVNSYRILNSDEEILEEEDIDEEELEEPPQ